jgi:hypothetical protein
MKKNEISGEYGTFGGEHAWVQRFCEETWWKNYLQDLDVDGRIMFIESLRNKMGAWMGLFWLSIGTNAWFL